MLKELTTILTNPNENVIFAYLFGSQARGQEGPLSDVDIAVYLEAETDPVQVKLDLIGKLADVLGTDYFDLVILNTAPLPLAARVIRDSQLLVDRNAFLRQRYESLILREYFDFSLFEESILSRRFALGR